MTLEQLCIEQENIIEKQAAMIRGLLYELAQFRALDEAEQQLINSTKGDQNAES
ncbi:MAG: hypothetical protein IKF99_00150 [Oscillospiraceae bacterium]|nr:hypothetical protein [Oscillospiraceae bacterium]